jgi:hypothetical protein
MVSIARNQARLDYQTRALHVCRQRVVAEQPPASKPAAATQALETKRVEYAATTARREPARSPGGLGGLPPLT